MADRQKFSEAVKQIEASLVLSKAGIDVNYKELVLKTFPGLLAYVLELEQHIEQNTTEIGSRNPMKGAK